MHIYIYIKIHIYIYIHTHTHTHTHQHYTNVHMWLYMNLCMYVCVCTCMQTHGIALALPHVLAHHTHTYPVFCLCGGGIGLEQSFHHAQFCLVFCCIMQWEHAILRQQHERWWKSRVGGGRERERYERDDQSQRQGPHFSHTPSPVLFLSRALFMSLNI